jgi:hypothetical protein
MLIQLLEHLIANLDKLAAECDRIADQVVSFLVNIGAD